jgi:hypothetical protein
LGEIPLKRAACPMLTGHVVTVRNNAVADQLGVLNILLHRSARQRVRHVLIIKEN